MEKGMSWNSKLIEKLLLTITIINLKWFTPKSKPVTYTKVLVELYNWRNQEQIYKIYKIIELKKIYVMIAKNSYNLGAY